MKLSRLKRRRRGFTLVELLVCIGILAVLIALVAMLSGRMKRRAGGIKDTGTMRQIHTAMILYAGDNNDTLPGPINVGQRSLWGPPSTGRLGYYIAGYLVGHGTPLQRDDFIEPMSFSWQLSTVARRAPAFYVRETVPIANGSSVIRPFGHPLRNGADRLPMQLSGVLSSIDTARQWAMTDIDQQHPDIGNPDWKPTVPPEMPHGSYRIGIFFDGRAGKLDKNNNPL